MWKLRALALVLTVLTGASGLVYEVAWQRYLAILLGSHGEATAAVLGIFLGGLAVGYRVFGAITRRAVERAQASGQPPRLLLLYGVVELGVGVYAWVFPWLFAACQKLSLALPLASAGAGFAFDVALTLLLLGPPTVLMGGTIPVLTQALSPSLAASSRTHALVYACNTAGAFVGALAAGFVLVPALGLAGVMRWVALVNLGAGVVFAGVGWWRPGASAAPLGAEPPAPVRVPDFASYAAVAALAGFAMMAIQTLLNRLGAFALGASQFTFAMVVASFVLCIALGSFAVSALPRIRPRHLLVSQWGLVVLLALLYEPLESAGWLGHRLRVPFRADPVAFWPYQAAVFAALLGSLAVPIGLSGALLPLLFHHLRSKVGDLGEVAGRLYAWNTLGSMAGALLGGYWLLLWLDLHAVYRLSVAALALASGLLTWRVLGTRRAALGAALAALIALALLPPWDPNRLASGLFRWREQGAGLSRAAVFAEVESYQQVLFHEDGPTASSTVTRNPRNGALNILSNGKSDGSTRTDYHTMLLTALVPALLADDCQRSFVVGWGTGVTIGELTELGCSREVVVAEIAQGVLDAAPLFDAWTHGASRDPKVSAVLGDAYRILLRDESRFDLILSEPSNPWVVGVENLYSREFLEAARQRLSPGGVYAQWFHLYEMDEPTVALVLRTYAEVFPHVAVWQINPGNLLLLGFEREAGALDLERLAERARLPDYRRALSRVDLKGVAALLALERLPLGVVHAQELEGPVHTLLDPILSDQAARAFFVGEQADLPPLLAPAALATARDHALLRRWVEAAAEPARELAQAARAACRLRLPGCPALLAAARTADPESTSDFTARVDETQVAVLRDFWGEDASGALSPEETARRAALWRSQLHHGLPFPAGSWQRLWERCESPRGRLPSCARARAVFERRAD